MITKTWNDIKWIFEADSSLRDIYVQDVNRKDWETLIDFLNNNYELKFGEQASTQIDKEYTLRFLADETGEMEIKSVRINLDEITVCCYFFLPDQIEFDIDTKEIKSIEDFERLENFMISISKALKTQVTLTGENSPEFPWIKIDFDKGINTVLTEEQSDKIIRQFLFGNTPFETKFTVKLSDNQLMENAKGKHSSTSRDKNLW